MNGAIISPSRTSTPPYLIAVTKAISSQGTLVYTLYLKSKGWLNIRRELHFKQMINDPVGSHDAIGSKMGFSIIKWISKL